MPEPVGRIPLLAITPFLWTVGEDAGMPSAYRALTGLSANGFDVHVVLPQRQRSRERDYRGLHLHPYRVPAFGLRGDFGPSRSPLLLDAPAGPAAGLRWKAFLAAMLGAAIRRGLLVARDVRPALVYGILPTGALAAAAVGQRKGIPNVARLFGTHLGHVHGRALLGHLWELAAFKAPAHLLIVTDDGTLGDEVARRLRVPPDRLRFLMNGVDERFLEKDGPTDAASVKRSLGIDPALPFVVFAHHLFPSHHPVTLVHALERLRRDGVVVAAALAGDGPERVCVEAAVREGGLEEHVRVLGNVSRSEIRDLMTAADAVVSLDELSNLVNSVLEALALGVPVIATDTGGTGRLLDEGNALLLREPDPGEIANALRRLVEDADLAGRLREGAAATARERLESWDERVAREARMLAEVLS